MKKRQNTTKDFKFKRFDIYGGLSGMPVSTDSVLLGAWINADQNKSILDIGTGTGLLSLMCAQRFSLARITAIEIDQAAYEAAKINFEISPWNERISLIHDDIRHWKSNLYFDTIVCNPPYFNSGEQSKISNRALARHTNSLSHLRLLEISKQLITPQGKANYILPYTEGMAFIKIAEEQGWFVSRLCEITPTDTKPVNRILMELCCQTTITKQTKLMINQAGQYTPDFIALTKDFYLKM